MSDKMVLYPYLKGQTWVFDDENMNLKEEAFVMGMSEIMSATVAKKKIKKAKKGFQCTFSDKPFKGYDVELTWFKEGELSGKYKLEIDGEIKEISFSIPGNWYHTGKTFKKKMKGWLCPALLKYFSEPPKKLYCACDKLPKGVDPIWHKPTTDAMAYVTA